LKTKFVYVEPRSTGAKDRFENLMDKFHSCKVKEETADKMYLSSISGRYSFWMNKEYDRDWQSIK
tara:strand:- start:815 stop:1009 length:195 start_codon:yes stop_codon:yes gene_type:complete